MLFQQGDRAAQQRDDRGLSRPFLIGLVVLLLFLTTTELGSNPPRPPAQSQTLAASPSAKLNQEVAEKLLFDLSTTNERLEKEKRALMQQALLLRSLLRKCRAARSYTNSTVELDDEINADLQQMQDLLQNTKANSKARLRQTAVNNTRLTG